MLEMTENMPYDEHFVRGTPALPFDYHYMDLFHPRFIMPYHYHIDQELIRIRKGGLDIRLNERFYALREGDYLFIQDGVVHGGKPLARDNIYECVVFNLDRIFDTDRPAAFALKKLSRHSIIPRELFQRDREPQIAAILDAFFDNVAARKESNSLLNQGLLLSFLGSFYAAGDFSELNDKVSARFSRHLTQSNVLFRFIYDNYARDLTLEDMAGVLDLSPKYFCRFFKELTGMRPMEYLNRFRIDCASVALSSSKESVNQIAFDNGFKDPGYFTKLFTRYKHISPTTWRRLAQSGGNNGEPGALPNAAMLQHPLIAGTRG